MPSVFWRRGFTCVNISVIRGSFDFQYPAHKVCKLSTLVQFFRLDPFLKRRSRCIKDAIHIGVAVIVTVCSSPEFSCRRPGCDGTMNCRQRPLFHLSWGFCHTATFREVFPSPCPYPSVRLIRKEYCLFSFRGSIIINSDSLRKNFLSSGWYNFS
jgi:hypothetical protein